ncbi:MAG: TonB family protein [Limisphaerales bacterium]
MQSSTQHGGGLPLREITPPLTQVAISRKEEDEWRPLAWVSSICILFLIIGLFGLKARPTKEPVPFQRVQVVPVVFTAPAPPEKQQPVLIEKSTSAIAAEEPAPPIVAASDAVQVNFPVAVQSPTAIVAPRYALPPPVQTRPPAAVVTEFNPDSATHGYFPKPKYPAGELAARHQGKVLLLIVVGTDGKPESVDVKESSGWPKLDNAALEKARKDWDFGPGSRRYFDVPVVFQIQ